MGVEQLDICIWINDPLSADIIHRDKLEMAHRSKTRAKTIQFLEEKRRKSFWIWFNKYFLGQNRT